MITILEEDGQDNPPAANVDIASTQVEEPVTLSTLDNDYSSNDGVDLDPSTVAITESPGYGMVLVDPITGDITYTPNPGFIGMDTLTYTVLDAEGNESTAQQIITVLGPGEDNTTTAADDNAITAYNEEVSGNVSSNDTDAEGDSDSTNDNYSRSRNLRTGR